MPIRPNFEKKPCKVCGVVKPRIKGAYRGVGQGHWFHDASGGKWYGSVCHPCHKDREWVRFGCRSRDKSAAATTRKGRAAERVVAAWFEKQGFAVALTRCKGPDVTATIPGFLTLTCEVKSLSRGDKHSRRYRTAAVHGDRKGDDLIAFVFPDNSILFEMMEDHLAKVTPSGVRSFSFGDLPPPSEYAKAHTRRFTDAQIAEIKALKESGQTASAVARRFGVVPNTVLRIWTGQRRAAPNAVAERVRP